MKVTETVERECCTRKDLKPYKGLTDAYCKPFSPYFCVYCGQVWVVDSDMGPAGSSEPVNKRVVLSYITATVSEFIDYITKQVDLTDSYAGTPPTRYQTLLNGIYSRAKNLGVRVLASNKEK